MNEVITPGTALNQTCTVADTEYPIALPDGCQHFSIQCRTNDTVRFAFVTGKVAGPSAPYLTLKPGQTYTSPEKMSLPASKSIYVASSVAGVVVEVIPWIKA